MEDHMGAKRYTTTYYAGRAQWPSKGAMIHDHIFRMDYLGAARTELATDGQEPTEEDVRQHAEELRERAMRAEVLADGEQTGKTLLYIMQNEWDEYRVYLATRQL